MFIVFDVDFFEDDEVDIIKDVLVSCLFFTIFVIFGYEIIILLVTVLYEGFFENLILL